MQAEAKQLFLRTDSKKLIWLLSAVLGTVMMSPAFSEPDWENEISIAVCRVATGIVTLDIMFGPRREDPRQNGLILELSEEEQHMIDKLKENLDQLQDRQADLFDSEISQMSEAVEKSMLSLVEYPYPKNREEKDRNIEMLADYAERCVEELSQN